MTGSGFGKLAALLMAALFALIAMPSVAQAAPAAPALQSCVAYAPLGIDSTKAATSPATRWDCSGVRPSMKPDRVLFRFALPENGAKPEYVTFRRAAFERLHLLVVDADGAVRGRYYGLNDLTLGKSGGYVRGDLPPLTERSRYAVAVIDQPTHSMMLTSVELGRGDPGDNAADLRLLLLLAALIGMLVMPLAFNIAFYRVLRERFLLWHAAMAMTLLGIIAFTSGLSVYVVDLGMGTLNTLMALVYGASVATGAMFAATFIEPGKLHPGLRRALPICAVWSMVVSGFHALFPFVMRPVQVDIAYLAFLPIMAVFFLTVIDASMRGSRAVRFQIVGWMPLMLVVLLRIVSQVVPLLHPTDAMVLFYLGTVFEALATTLGVADRFMTIRHQRDMARTEADMLEKLSEHDPLTGLLNRRGIEPGFGELRNAGYDTFALLDLDHFKRVNDDFGHAVGDKVLKAVAEALQNHPDTMAVRMGGEEFALLMRGPNTQERAERMRQTIPVRVARSVPELDRMVTASMGLLELPRHGLKGVGFKEFYAKADKLLYEAKSGGRNRLISERMRMFVPRRNERRRAA
jgi:diguanylate cyclase (GGDEF)-like protein